MDRTDIEANKGQNPINVWLKADTVAKEILNKHQTVNYPQILANNRVLFLGDNHGNQPIRKHLVTYSRRIKTAGITHYAVEAKESGNEVFERLNRGEQVDLSKVDVGPGRQDYEEVIRAMAVQGIQVVAIDIDQNSKPTKEERESRITENLTRILQDPKAKVAVLMGRFHTSRKVSTNNVFPVGRRLIDASISVVNVAYTGGMDNGPTLLTEGARNAGLDGREFMFDLRPYSSSQYVPYGSEEIDWVIHLPQFIETSKFSLPVLR